VWLVCAVFLLLVFGVVALFVACVLRIRSSIMGCVRVRVIRRIRIIRIIASSSDESLSY